MLPASRLLWKLIKCRVQILPLEPLRSRVRVG